MIDAVMLWNEPNNMSHWDFQIDSDWALFARMIKSATAAIRAEAPQLTQVLGGISPIDPAFMKLMSDSGVVSQVDAVAVHGFPLDWNHWNIDEWPSKLAEICSVVQKPVWVSEVGASSFGAEEVQKFGLERTAELLLSRAQRVYWYSLFDLPKAWPATTRHREAEGSSYYRHFYMGLIKENGDPKLAFRQFSRFTPDLGICQWVHFEDPRLHEMATLLRDLGVKKLRTGLSWADSYRPGAMEWFDKQMKALDGFDLTVTFCFTPEHKGVVPNHTSPPAYPEEFGEFCANMTRRYCK